MAERINGHTELIGLTAAPIRHSKSPEMYNGAFAKLGLDYAYLAFEVGNEELKDAVKGFKALKMHGYNASMPNKTIIRQYLDHLSPAAGLYGTVNTAVNNNGVLVGRATDDIGYMRSLEDAGIESAGKKVTIIGAGGAAMVIEIRMALDRAKETSIFNRRDEFQERTEQNVKNISEKTGCKVTLFGLADTETLKHEVEDSYLFANATGVGTKPLEGQIVIPDASLLCKGLVVTDVIYMPTETELLRIAKEVGCKTMNNLGMTLYQSATAFEL